MEPKSINLNTKNTKVNLRILLLSVPERGFLLFCAKSAKFDDLYVLVRLFRLFNNNKINVFVY